MKARPSLLLASLAGLAMLVAVIGLGRPPREAPELIVGKAAPAFALPDLHRPERSLGPAQMKGQVWLLNVWASWCAPCREEHPLLVALAREHQVPIVGLNHQDDPRNALEWLIRLGDPYHASIVDREGRVGVDYGVRGVPETFLIDRDGIVRLRHVGPLTQEVWTSRIEPLLREPGG